MGVRVPVGVGLGVTGVRVAVGDGVMGVAVGDGDGALMVTVSLSVARFRALPDRRNSAVMVALPASQP